MGGEILNQLREIDCSSDIPGLDLTLTQSDMTKTV